MSFKSKIDFCGLADGTTIKLKSHAEGAGSTVVTCENDEGDTVDTTVVGKVKDPTNTYALAADATDLEIVLGKITTVDNKHYVLKSVTIGTSNAGEVSISAAAEETPNATASRTYTVTIASLKRRNKAQILNSLFTLSGTGCHLQSASYTLSVNTQQTTVDGDRVGTDVYGGKIVVTLEAKQAGTTAPTITAGTGAVLTGEVDETRPDSDYATVAAEVTLNLTPDAD